MPHMVNSLTYKKLKIESLVDGCCGRYRPLQTPKGGTPQEINFIVIFDLINENSPSQVVQGLLNPPV